MLSAVAVFFLAFGWFAFFSPWGGFNDPDAFYHAKIAELISQRGPLHAFPWLDLTSVNSHFADLHFLFHVALIPFERVFGMMLGARVAAVFFAALFLAIFYSLLRRARAPLPWMFAGALAFTPFMIIRLSLAKASPLALIWFFLGMAAVSIPSIKHRSRFLFAAFAGCGFALTHGGWLILVICQVLYTVGEAMFFRVVEECSWKEAWRRSAWDAATVSFFAGAIGTILHPNFPENIIFLRTQIWSIAVMTPLGRVRMGNEWLPVSARELVGNASTIIILAFAVFYGLLTTRRATMDSIRMRAAVAWGMPSAFLAAITFKSFRFGEYLFPTLIFWIAATAANMDARAFIRRIFTRRAMYVLIIFLAVSVARQLYIARSSMLEHPWPFGAFQETMRAVAERAAPNERVFNASWDLFPQLFASNDRYRYVSGLDPTFLLEANPELSDRYSAIMANTLATGTRDAIKNDFGSRWVILDTRRQRDLDRTLEQDPRFILHSSTTVAKVYEIVE